MYGERDSSGLIKTNWWVVTGGPSSGKSTLLTYMSFQGDRVVPEAARVLIDYEISRGRTLADIRRDEQGFQDDVYDLKGDLEDQLPPDQKTYLERGKDGDSLAYNIFLMMMRRSGQLPKFSEFLRRPSSRWRAEGEDFQGDPETTLVMRHRYAGVFILDRLPYVKDYARTEDDEQAELIHKLLWFSYKQLHYEPIRVPVMPLDQRANFIRRHTELLPHVELSICQGLFSRW